MNDTPQFDRCKQNCCSRIENLSVFLNRQIVLDNINLHFHCGELTVLIGPNGGGKTTLLRAMVGELPHSGIIKYHGVNKTDKYCLKIGYVPQRLLVDQGNPMSVRDLFQSALTWKPVWMIHDKWSSQQAINGLAQMNAEYLLNKKICELSGGELQRVMVALAITPVPDILLLDEPVSGVDHRGLTTFYNAISKLRQMHDLSIVMVSHDLALASRFADRMILIDKKIHCEGKPADILANPLTKTIMGYGTADGEDSPGRRDHHTN